MSHRNPFTHLTRLGAGVAGGDVARVRMLEEELEEVEEKWTAKLEDVVEEIGLLTKEKKEGMAAANEKLVAVSAECKGRRKEIATLRGAVANMKKGKRVKVSYAQQGATPRQDQ